MCWVFLPALLLPAPARAAGTPRPALYAQSQGAENRFSGASFSPSIAPVVTKSRVAKDVTLTWAAVTIRPGTTVTYSVVRYHNGSGPVAVCTGAAGPVLSTGTVTCVDQNVPSGSLTYSEQPVVITDGSVTWSLPPSTPA